LRYETIELIEQINKGENSLEDKQNETPTLNFDLNTSNLLSSDQNTMNTNEYLANIEITNGQDSINDHLNVAEIDSNNIYLNRINSYQSDQNYACEMGVLSPIKQLSNPTYNKTSSQQEAINFLIPISSNSISVELTMTEHSNENMDHCTNTIEFDFDNILSTSFGQLKQQFNQHDQHIEDENIVQAVKTVSNVNFSLSNFNENSNDNSSLKIFMIDRLLDEDLKQFTSN